MAIVVGVAGKGDVESILEADEALHGIGRGGVHANLPVPIQRHETKGGIDLFIDHGEIEAESFGDARPVVHARAAQGVDAHPDARAAYRVHVQNGAEIAHVNLEVIVSAGGGGTPRRGESHSVDRAGT